MSDPAPETVGRGPTIGSSYEMVHSSLLQKGGFMLFARRKSPVSCVMRKRLMRRMVTDRWCFMG